MSFSLVALSQKVATMTPPGTVAYFGHSAVPNGWLACDGSAVSRAMYADLFTAIGTTYGAGDGSTTFNIPDLRGVVARGHDSMGTSSTARGLDPGRVLGSYQADAYASHNHGVNDPGHQHVIGFTQNYSVAGQGNFSTTYGGVGGGAAALSYSGSTAGNNLVANQTGTGITVASSGGTETRPKNLAMIAGIEY